MDTAALLANSAAHNEWIDTMKKDLGKSTKKVYPALTLNRDTKKMAQNMTGENSMGKEKRF